MKLVNIGKRTGIVLLVFIFLYSASLLLRGYKLNKKLIETSRIYQSERVSEGLGGYYLTSSCERENQPLMDENGVVLIDYSKTTIRGITATHYVPGGIGQYALCVHQKFIETEDVYYLEIFLNQADWLVENQQIHKSDDIEFGVWSYDFPLPQFDLDAGWASALSQGVSLSTLLRAYEETGDDEYLLTAKKAFEAFKVPVDEKGVLWGNEDRLVFFEEIPKPIHILNGNIFGFLGVYDYYQVTNSPQASKLLDKNTNTLNNWLDEFDTGYWSKYSLDPHKNISNHFTVASPAYHDLHIDQLYILANLTKNQNFYDTAQQWERDEKTLFGIGIASSYILFRDISFLKKAVSKL